MAELTEPQKHEIVEALACFVPPSTIVKQFGEDHDLILTRAQVGSYDPTRPYFEAGDKWRQVFESRRKAYLEEVNEIPVASQAYRLNLLQKGIEAAERKGQFSEAAALAEQAAKEMGGLLTNQRSVAIETRRAGDPRDMSPEDRKLALAELLHGALELARARLPDPAKVIEG